MGFSLLFFLFVFFSWGGGGQSGWSHEGEVRKDRGPFFIIFHFDFSLPEWKEKDGRRGQSIT